MELGNPNIHGDKKILKVDCHNPSDNSTIPQHNLNTAVGLSTEMTVDITPPHKLNGSLQ